MADVFENKLIAVTSPSSRKKAIWWTCPPISLHRFDGYKKAMDCLKPGDVAIFATPPAFRWVHFQYAIEKGLNVFMEKPRHRGRSHHWTHAQAADEADKKNLKVGVGLMVRHCRGRQELKKRIDDGEIGD